MNELAPHPLVALRLRGNQAEMGAQQGTLLRSLGGHERALSFYPRMAARLIASNTPHGARRAVETLSLGALHATARLMHAHRRKRFPEYTARTEALLAAAGAPAGTAPSFLVMEVLQNTIGLLGRAGALSSTPLAHAAIPACSSLAVWGARSEDGALRHARNFDFPGAGVWDLAPLVVLCEPDEGLRYGFVTTRGADVPGITAFNEAGLTLTAHTRFHRDVRFDKAPVFDLGHEIVRSARTLGEAIDIARRHGAASTWGLLVSSAEEHDAVVIETTGEAVESCWPEPGHQHLACTNRYLGGMSAGEVAPNRAFVFDSDARLARLEACAREADGGLSAADLEQLLGDLCSPDARDLSDDVARLAGDCLVSPITVQSVVAEPEQRRIRVSVGRAPTSFGPYVEVPWAWDGPVGVVSTEAPSQLPIVRDHRGAELSHEKREVIRAYVEVARLHFDGAAPSVVRGLVEGLVRRAPTEPHFRALAAFTAMAADEPEVAAAHLEVALRVEGGTFRRARLLLWQTRVLAALGRELDAERARRELLALPSAIARPEQDAARTERRRPVSRARLRRVAPDFFLVDASLPGAGASA